MKTFLVCLLFFVCGIMFGVAFDTRDQYRRNCSEASGGIRLYIGHNPDLKCTASAVGTFHQELSETKQWDETWVKIYKDRSKAVDMRNKVLKILDERD